MMMTSSVGKKEGGGNPFVIVRSFTEFRCNYTGWHTTFAFRR
jgi:hypothetical protein